METYLRCSIQRGLFANEAAVHAIDADGKEFSLFVDDDRVEGSERDLTDQWIQGWLRVEVLDVQGPVALVRLPSQAFENGKTVGVWQRDLETRTLREPA